MNVPSHADALEVLFLQAAADGRGSILFGDCPERVRTKARPFMIGKSFPSVYLEFPLSGDPFLDITVLYNELEPGVRITSDAAAGTEGMIDWFAGACSDMPDVCCGFELDTKRADLPAAAMHFQPRVHTELVEPFCKAAGEPERARLYLDLSARMPHSWPLSFFGMFRGRPSSPLRVCGYLAHEERTACSQDPGHLAAVFDSIGFAAYDDAMLAQVSELMGAAPGSVDFQFDVFADGTIGSIFAIDVQFEIEQPHAVLSSFENGQAAKVMNLLAQWGIADSRRELAPKATFARAIPVKLDDGSTGRYAFTLMPQWVKVRWSDAVLQPSKLYLLAKAGLVES